MGQVDIPTPEFTGVRTLDSFSLEELRGYIDWSPFFLTWELRGKYPKIFEDEHVGVEAKKLFDDAGAMLDRVIAEGSLGARGVYGFFPAATDGEDIVVYTDESRSTERCRLHCLRQQWERKGQKDFRSLADYIAPIESGRQDYVGGFAVTTGVGCEELAAAFDADHDDYNSILIKAIADRPRRGVRRVPARAGSSGVGLRCGRGRSPTKT